MSSIAIVMTTYNGERYIGDQLESILSSTYQDFELYIYDDGSKDTTLSILRSYESRYPQKIHVHQNETNLGVTKNFLHAFSRTTTDYVMFCDQDDVWKTSKAATSLKRMKTMEAQLGKDCPIAVFTDAIVVDVELNTLNDSFFCSGHLNPMKTDLPHLLMENKLIGCTVMVNAALRKVMQSQSLPKQARYHDWWIALIAASMGKIGFVNEGTLLYRQHGGNVVGDTGFAAYVKNRLLSLGDQKKAIKALYLQAEEFLTLYCEMLPEENKAVILRFVSINHMNFLSRRIEVIRGGYLKTGCLRNVGLLFIL